MRQNLYFIHPITASFDPRMEAMEEKLHGKGYGGYWYIREKMSLFLHDRCRLKDLKPFATKYFSFKLIKTIVMESDLFYFDGEYIVAKELNCDDPQNTRGNAGEESGKQAKNSKKTRKTTQKQAENDEKSAKNSGKTAKNGSKKPGNAGNPLKKASEKQSENEDNKQGTSALESARSTSGQKERTPSNTNTAHIYREKETEIEITEYKEAADADDAAHAAGNGDKSAPGSRAAATGNRPPQPICDWQRHLEALGTDSQWTDIACMKSGFGPLLKKHFGLAKEYFRKHVIAYGKGSTLATEQDVTYYFMSFIMSPTTSKGLRQYLQAMEQSAPEQAPDPYRYEQRLDGRRVYNGHRIPHDAPPRPDAHSRWNDTLHRWEPEYG